ncbi:unnamed protein product [Calypogeia fissa]
MGQAWAARDVMYYRVNRVDKRSAANSAQCGAENGAVRVCGPSLQSCFRYFHSAWLSPHHFMRDRETAVNEHEAAAAQLDAERTEHMAQLEDLKDQVREKERQLQEIAEQVLYLPNREEKVELLKHLAFGKEAGPALLTKVDKEVLTIWGEADNIFPLEQAERIKDMTYQHDFKVTSYHIRETLFHLDSTTFADCDARVSNWILSSCF